VCANTTSCKTTCASDSDCASAGDYCDTSHACVPKVAAGDACGADDECTTGVCGIAGTGGHCCTVACIPAGGDCGATDCNASGACVFPGSGVAPAGLQTPNDCHKVVCDSVGGTTSVPDGTDVPVASTVCLINPQCFGGTQPTFDAAPTGTDCTADGQLPKHVCGDPAIPAIAGKCVECNVDADCNAINDAGTLTCNTSTGVCQ
jgi:hypothetical protein